MAKKVGVAIMGIFVLLIVGFNIYSFSSSNRTDSGMTGNAISDLSSGINISLIAFVLQWVILLMIVIFAYSRFIKHRKEEELKIVDYVIPKPSSKAETDIDFFYDLIKEKQSLTVGTVAKAFNITKDQALEWAKVLEEQGHLAIEYPAFSDPEVKLPGPSDEEKKKLSAKKKEEEQMIKTQKQEVKAIEKNTKNAEKKIEIKKEEKLPVQAKPLVETKLSTEQPKPGEISKEDLEKKLNELSKNQNNVDDFKPKK